VALHDNLHQSKLLQGSCDLVTTALLTQEGNCKLAQTEMVGPVGRPAGFKSIAHCAVRALTLKRVVELGATGHFLQKGVSMSTGLPSLKVVGMPNGQTVRAL